ncbi:MAG: hypothetical protein R3C39_03080 [Dehalococcoidia bacterium]
MNRLRSFGMVAFAAAVVAVLAIGCSSDDEPTSTPSPTSTSEPSVTATATPTSTEVPPATATPGEPLPTATPTGTLVPLPGPGETIEVPAPIVSVDVRVAESFPPQYFVEVVSAQPDGCHRFSRYEVSRDGTTVRIDVYNTRPEDLSVVLCTMIYGETTSNVALGSDFESGVEYTLEVNDVTQTFTAQ